MVGDTLRDLQAAQAAGCEPHLVRSGRAAALERGRGGTPCCIAQVPRHLRARTTWRPSPTHLLRTRQRRRRRSQSDRLGRLLHDRADRSAALRSALFLLWMLVTVVPVATAVVLASIFIQGTPLYWMCVFWLRLVIWGARVICGVRHRVQGMEQPAHRARRPARGAAGVQAPVHLGDLRLPGADVAPAVLRVQEGAAANSVLRLGHGQAGHDPHRPQQAHRGLEQGGRAGRAASWRRATGSSCSPKARAARAASKGSTSRARRGWPSPPARRSCPSPWPRRAAGRARASCCARA